MGSSEPREKLGGTQRVARLAGMASELEKDLRELIARRRVLMIVGRAVFSRHCEALATCWEAQCAVCQPSRLRASCWWTLNRSR
jgi:hypothetical protein